MESRSCNCTTEPAREPREPVRSPCSKQCDSVRLYDDSPAHHEISLSRPEPSSSETGRSPIRPQPGRSRVVPRWVEVEFVKLSECETEQQFWDCDNPRFSRMDVIGKRITLTSVRERKSDYGDRIFVVIGFTCDELGDGQFQIGGNAASLPLQLAESGDLPVNLVFRHKRTKSGRDFYRWEYPACRT